MIDRKTEDLLWQCNGSVVCCLAVASWGSVGFSTGAEWGAGALQGEVYMKGDNEIELKRVSAAYKCMCIFMEALNCN